MARVPGGGRAAPARPPDNGTLSPRSEWTAVAAWPAGPNRGGLRGIGFTRARRAAAGGRGAEPLVAPDPARASSRDGHAAAARRAGELDVRRQERAAH
jgi:hypothetical protein